MIGVLLAGAAFTPMRSIGYEKFRYQRGVYHVVKADLSSGTMRPQIIFSESLLSPWNLVAKLQPAVAITGTFFAPQNGVPVADVLIDGTLVARGNRGTVLAVTLDGEIVIADKPFRRRFDWSGMSTGLRGAVRLITNGRVNPNPKAQNFRDPRIWGRAARTGWG